MGWLRGLKPSLHAAASRRHEDKFDSSVPTRRRRGERDRSLSAQASGFFVKISPLRGFEKEVGQIRQISLLWKNVCVFQTQSIYYRSYRAGRRPSASAYAAISKIIALQAILAKGFSHWRPMGWLRGLKPSLHAAASRRHEDKFDSSVPTRRRTRRHTLIATQQGVGRLCDREVNPDSHASRPINFSFFPVIKTEGVTSNGKSSGKYHHYEQSTTTFHCCHKGA